MRERQGGRDRDRGRERWIDREIERERDGEKERKRENGREAKRERERQAEERNNLEAIILEDCVAFPSSQDGFAAHDSCHFWSDDSEGETRLLLNLIFNIQDLIRVETSF